ncbi:VanZ family protein [Lysobacter humi (ex Lee et al. 2017)]
MLRPLRWPRLAVAGWIALFALVAVGSLMPARELPTPSVQGLDKLEHLLGYAALSGYAVLLFATARARWAAAALVMLFGLGIEAAQAALTTSREADPADVVANGLGALLGQLLAHGRFARFLERRDIDESSLRSRSTR